MPNDTAVLTHRLATEMVPADLDLLAQRMLAQSPAYGELLGEADHAGFQ
jgi:hypothetical protein